MDSVSMSRAPTIVTGKTTIACRRMRNHDPVGGRDDRGVDRLLAVISLPNLDPFFCEAILQVILIGFVVVGVEQVCAGFFRRKFVLQSFVVERGHPKPAINLTALRYHRKYARLVAKKLLRISHAGATNARRVANS